MAPEERVWHLSIFLSHMFYSSTTGAVKTVILLVSTPYSKVG